MPRKTPVRELQKEEPVVSSPLRRSSRLNASSPVPTKVVTRRSSASEVPVPSATITRSRRSSLSQETQSAADLQSDKKKLASTIRTRRNSQNAVDPVQEGPVQKTRTRGSSVPKEQTVEVKNITKRRGSNAEDSEVDAEPIKKVTRSRSGSLSKKEDDDVKASNKKQASSVKDSAASTPVKKKSSSPQSVIVVLESIEETIKEVDSSKETTVVKGKKKIAEVSRIDFDLSVINETSLTEEESPQKKNVSKHEVQDQSDEKEKEPELKKYSEENVLDSQRDVLTLKEDTPDISLIKNSLEQKPVSDDSVSKDGKKNTDEFNSSQSDSSFHLELSSSVFENSNKNETGALDISNKENVCPKTPVQQSECEPMDVDDSVLELPSPINNVATKSPKKYIEKRENEIERKLQIAEKVTDEIANFLSEEILLTVEQKSKEEREDDVKEAKNTSITENGKSDISLGTSSDGTKQDESEQNSNQGFDSEDVRSVAHKNEEKLAATNLRKSLDEDEVKETDLAATEKPANEEEITEAVLAECPSEEAEQLSSASCLENETEADKETGHSETVSSEIAIASSLESETETDKETGHSETASSKTANTSETNVVIEAANRELSPESESAKSVSSQADVKITSEVPAESSISSEEKIKDTIKSENKDAASHQGSPVKEHRRPEFLEKANENGDAAKESDKTDDCDTPELVPVPDAKKVVVSEKETSSSSPKIEKDSYLSLQEIELMVNGNSGKDSSNDNDLDSEVTKINENKIPIEDTETVEQTESINLCDSESDQEVNIDSCEDEDSYRSPVKKLRTHLSVSDDEVFVRKDTKVPKRDIFDRSIDSKYYISMRTPKAVKAKSQPNTTSEVIELSDKDEEEETVERSDQACNLEFSQNLEDEDVHVEVVTEDLNREDRVENSITRNRKRSLDKASIVLQETIQAGEDPEKSLSGRIHNVVDLFCAGLKNKSDIAVNVSFECTGQGSDSEDENKAKVIEISFTASGIDGMETQIQKGSKRRKICQDDDADLESSEIHDYKNESTDKDLSQTPVKSPGTTSNEEAISSAKKSKKRQSIVCDFGQDIHQSTPKLSEAIDIEERVASAKKSKKRDSMSSKSSISSPVKQSKHNDTFEMSPKPSVSSHPEETVTSVKKNRKRRSILEEIQPIDAATKTSLKTSVTFDVKPEKSKNRRSSGGDSKTSEESVPGNQTSPVHKKKSIPATPFKSSNTNGKPEVESSEATESSDDEDNESVTSEQQNSQYERFFSTSYGESDANDTTWTPQTDMISNSSDSDEEDSDVDVDEEMSDEEMPPIVEGKRRPKDTSCSSADDVFVDAVAEKEKSPGKSNKRKLFRMSKYDISKAVASSESEENNSEKLKPKKKGSKESNDFGEASTSKAKNIKTKHTNFIKSKNVKNMFPEISETESSSHENIEKKRKNVVSCKSEEQAGRKRKAENVEDLSSGMKVGRDSKKKPEVNIQIKPSAGNRKNVKPLGIKPSTKTTSDWDITTFS